MKKFHFTKAKFYVTVNDLHHLPNDSHREIAIVGRSNAGKSSLINKLTNQNRLAFTSKTPGRTQHINYFSLDDSGTFLVDLPGYGYAKVPEKIRNHWVDLLTNYLQQREQLVGLILIMDSRHPLKDLDYKMLEFFGFTKKPIHIVLSKSDKLTTQEKTKTLSFVKSELVKNGFTNYSIQLFSSPKRLGIEELETSIQPWIYTAKEELQAALSSVKELDEGITKTIPINLDEISL